MTTCRMRWRGGAPCCLPLDHDGPCRYKCAGDHCPGLLFPASEMGHPASCLTGTATVVFSGTAPLSVELPRDVVHMATELSKRGCVLRAQVIDDAYMLEVRRYGLPLAVGMAARDDDEDCAQTAEVVIRDAFGQDGEVCCDS